MSASKTWTHCSPRPRLRRRKSTAPTMQNTGKAHGSALGDDEIAATKRLLGFDPATFAVPDAVLRYTRAEAERSEPVRRHWSSVFEAWRTANPDRAALLDRLQKRHLPDGWTDALPTFAPDPKGITTRKASGEILTALPPVLPELRGGSADLAESNNTTMEDEPSFIPMDRQTTAWAGGPYGRTRHVGIREHAVGAILNGIALQSLTRPYSGPFLVFSDYMRPAVRLAVLMQLPATYVWTHDSIDLVGQGVFLREAAAVVGDAVGVLALHPAPAGPAEAQPFEDARMTTACTRFGEVAVRARTVSILLDAVEAGVLDEGLVGPCGRGGLDAGPQPTSEARPAPVSPITAGPAAP
jgi:transketolase